MGIIKINGKLFGGSSVTAKEITYDTAVSGLESSTVQGAIDSIALSINDLANSDAMVALENRMSQAETKVSTNTIDITNLGKKIPFSLGVDSSGNYGYIKAGADTVTPFKTDTSIQVVASATGKTGSESAFTIHTTTQKWRELYVITNSMRTNAGATSTHSQGTQVLRGQCVDSPGYSYLHVTKLTNVAKGTAIKCALYYVYNFIILGVV